MAATTKDPQAPIQDVDSLHSVGEACATLKIGQTKCWELIGNGALEAVRLGNRCTRITKSSIKRLATNGVK
jgi:excisionase family DNA binding protein